MSHHPQCQGQAQMVTHNGRMSSVLARKAPTSNIANGANQRVYSGYKMQKMSNMGKMATPQRKVPNREAIQNYTPNRTSIPFTDPASPFYKQYIEMSQSPVPKRTINKENVSPNR